jgi:prepilin-type N-terminal cleavage/methylation domain-containing protein
MLKTLTRPPGLAPGCPQSADNRGFTLIELLIVTVIIGLLASIALPNFAEVRQKALNAAAVSDLNSAALAIEEYFADNMALPNENQLMNSDFVLSPGVSFTTFEIRDAGDPRMARVHMHIEHEGSLHYYHFEYPGTNPPEKRWKS